MKSATGGGISNLLMIIGKITIGGNSLQFSIEIAELGVFIRKVKITQRSTQMGAIYLHENLIHFL